MSDKLQRNLEQSADESLKSGSGTKLSPNQQAKEARDKNEEDA